MASECTIGCGRWRIEYDPNDDLAAFILYDEDGRIDYWDNHEAMLMDVDYSPVGDAISLADWQRLWDWAHAVDPQ